jgi:hypothetical protein
MCERRFDIITKTLTGIDDRLPDVGRCCKVHYRFDPIQNWHEGLDVGRIAFGKLKAITEPPIARNKFFISAL